jgi:hypothetical protein
LNLAFRTSEKAKRQVKIPRQGMFVEKAIMTPSFAVLGTTKLMIPKGRMRRTATGRRSQAFFYDVFWMCTQ